jgi:hypothetical protein
MEWVFIMGKVTYKKKNKNRYRKVYPYVRKAPAYQYCADTATEMEVGSIDFSNSDTGTYIFTSTFPTVPVITAISYDSESNNSADVNVYVESISTTSVTIRTSAAFTGKIQFHAIMVEC